jgi:hypothetical protein
MRQEVAQPPAALFYVGFLLVMPAPAAACSVASFLDAVNSTKEIKTCSVSDRACYNGITSPRTAPPDFLALWKSCLSKRRGQHVAFWRFSSQSTIGYD